MIQVAKIIGTGLATTGLIGVAVGIGVVFGALIFGISRNSSLRGQLFSYAILGFAFAEATKTLKSVMFRALTLLQKIIKISQRVLPLSMVILQKNINAKNLEVFMTKDLIESIFEAVILFGLLSIIYLYYSLYNRDQKKFINILTLNFIFILLTFILAAIYKSVNSVFLPLIFLILLISFMYSIITFIKYRYYGDDYPIFGSIIYDKIIKNHKYYNFGAFFANLTIFFGVYLMLLISCIFFFLV